MSVIDKMIEAYDPHGSKNCSGGHLNFLRRRMRSSHGSAATGRDPTVRTSSSVWRGSWRPGGGRNRRNPDGEMAARHGDTIYLTPDQTKLHRFGADGKAI